MHPALFSFRPLPAGHPHSLKTGLWICISGLTLGCLAIPFTIPFFRFGPWADSAPAHLVLLISAALSAIGIAFCGIRSLAVLVLVPVLLGLWFAIVALVSSPYTGLALYGSPVTLEGPLLWLALACWAGAAQQCLHYYGRAGLVLPALAGLVALIWSVMANTLPQGHWASLYVFTDQTGITAIFLPLFVAILCPGPVLSRHSLWITGASIFLAAGIAWWSGNRSATVMLLAGGLWYPATLLAMRVLGDRRQVYIRIAAILVLFAVPVAVHGVILTAGKLYIPDSIHDQGFFYSLWSRWQYYALLFHDLYTDPLRFLGTGYGAGASITGLRANLAYSDFNFVQPVWDLAERGVVNSHSVYLEVLYAGGLPGLALFLLLLAAPVLLTPKKYLPVVTTLCIIHAGLIAFWFQLAIMVPFYGLLAGFGYRYRWRQLRFLTPVRGRITWIFLAGVMAFGAWWTFDWNNGMDLRQSAGQTGCRFGADTAMDNLGLSAALQESFRAASKTWQNDPAADTGGKRAAADATFECVLDIAAAEIRTHPSLFLATDILLVSSNQLILDSGQPLTPGLSEKIYRASIDAGFYLVENKFNRLDLVIPVLTTATAPGVAAWKKQQAEHLLGRMQSVWPDHPVTSWFSGQMLLSYQNIGDAIEGINLMLAAARHEDASRYLDIPPQLVSQLESTRNRLLLDAR